MADNVNEKVINAIEIKDPRFSHVLDRVLNEIHGFKVQRKIVPLETIAKQNSLEEHLKLFIGLNCFNNKSVS